MSAIDSFDEEALHSDDMQDIITTIPPWILRWGITLFFAVIMMMIGLSALIRYPDIIRASLKIASLNPPTPIISKMQGKLVRILVQDNTTVQEGTTLGYLESTADHRTVLEMLTTLKQLQQKLEIGKPIKESSILTRDNMQLGELQQAYQIFHQEYLSYRSLAERGFFIKKSGYLQKDLKYLDKQEAELNEGKPIQQQNLKLALNKYQMNLKLAKDKIAISTKLKQQDANYLSQKFPLSDMESALIIVGNNYSFKQKELIEINNQILEKKAKFLQALNNFIIEIEEWKNKYVLCAPLTGKLRYSAIIHENQMLQAGQEVFYINFGNEKFFGEMAISQLNMGKVIEGQQVLIKLKSYPFEEYGMISGYIKNIADVPYKDSVFMAEVVFNNIKTTDQGHPVRIKQGMSADAEIITQNATVLHRLFKSFYRVVRDK